MKLQLLNDWETTRYGQIKFITENKEKQLTVAADNYKKDATRELRLKHEIESLWKFLNFMSESNLKLLSAFLEERAEHFEGLTKQWTEKYEKEVLELDAQISETKDVMIALKLKYDDLVEQFNLREDEVQDYLEEKKIKDDAVMEVERRYQAIVKIQSWWKGIMVRKGLGQYRRKKSKKASKKAKGKKK